MTYKDYLTVISAPEQVDNKIKLFKRACAKHIGKFASMHSRAHITFATVGIETEKLRYDPLFARTIFDRIEMRLTRIPSREIKIKGFGYFNHGNRFKTIYCALELDRETTDWFDAIKQEIEKELNRKINLSPHITIARNIQIEYFNVLWPHFQKITYQDSFEAAGLTILEKENDNQYDRYKEYKKIIFRKRLPMAQV